MAKKRIIKKFEHLEPELRKLLHIAYPDGYEDELISFQSPKGELEFALPLETDEVSYLIKMPKNNVHESDDDDDSPSEENLGNYESLEAAENIADED